MAAFHDGCAMFAGAAGLGGRPALTIGADTVHAFGNDPGRGGFAGTADPCHDKGLRDSVCFKRVPEGPDHGVLPNEIRKSFRAVFSCENLVFGFGFVGHQDPCEQDSQNPLTVCPGAPRVNTTDSGSRGISHETIVPALRPGAECGQEWEFIVCG